ncbi:hypothetical protein P7K49_024219, partial [Saguinus oedipus]
TGPRPVASPARISAWLAGRLSQYPSTSLLTRSAPSRPRRPPPLTADLQRAPNICPASCGLSPPHLGSHLSATSNLAPASPPARGGGSARQS